jgi:hypothetical protein
MDYDAEDTNGVNAPGRALSFFACLYIQTAAGYVYFDRECPAPVQILIQYDEFKESAI